MTKKINDKNLLEEINKLPKPKKEDIKLHNLTFTNKLLEIPDNPKEMKDYPLQEYSFASLFLSSRIIDKKVFGAKFTVLEIYMDPESEDDMLEYGGEDLMTTLENAALVGKTLDLIYGKDELINNKKYFSDFNIYLDDPKSDEVIFLHNFVFYSDKLIDEGKIILVLADEISFKKEEEKEKEIEKNKERKKRKGNIIPFPSKK